MIIYIIQCLNPPKLAPAKGVYGELYRGFESLRLRHLVMFYIYLSIIYILEIYSIPSFTLPHVFVGKFIGKRWEN